MFRSFVFIWKIFAPIGFLLLLLFYPFVSSSFLNRCFISSLTLFILLYVFGFALFFGLVGLFLEGRRCLNIGVVADAIISSVRGENDQTREIEKKRQDAQRRSDNQSCRAALQSRPVMVGRRAQRRTFRSRRHHRTGSRDIVPSHCPAVLDWTVDLIGVDALVDFLVLTTIAPSERNALKFS